MPDREAAYQAATRLYADAIKIGAEALRISGTGGWKVSPVTARDYHRNVLEVAEFLLGPTTDSEEVA